MAKVYYNDREHLVIQMNIQEATEIGFGIPVTGLNNICLCGSCNKELKPEDIYYVCGINEVLCKDCIEDYVKNMNHYVDDDSLEYEIRHFNQYATELGIKERAVMSANGKAIICDIKDINDISKITMLVK